LRQSTITYFGGTESAGGSMHLLDTGGQRILFDCGKNVGGGIDLAFPFDPSSIDVVMLSHAHVDHCGNLPILVKQGFRGPIICTPATASLIETVLLDSAAIQERDMQRRYDGRRGSTMLQRFDTEDVEQTLDLICVAELRQLYTEMVPGLNLRLHESAHLLGSCLFEVMFDDSQGIAKKVVFTGDLGRFDFPYGVEPSMIPTADLILCESTYGGRYHDPFESTLKQLGSIVSRTLSERGKVLIPAFSLGRTHLLCQCLLELKQRGSIPDVPIYVDSPLASEFEYTYEEYGLGYSDSSNGQEGFDSSAIEWISSSNEAALVALARQPCIVIASGGMCDGGRILDHLKYHIDDPRCHLVLVSYQAEGTLGRQLMAPAPSVRIHGRMWSKWIQVTQIQGFSAHADQGHILKLFSETDRSSRIRLIHGDSEQKELLREQLRSKGFANTEIARTNQTEPI
jgi:metallo-beta-lactamase family protein